MSANNIGRKTRRSLETFRLGKAATSATAATFPRSCVTLVATVAASRKAEALSVASAALADEIAERARSKRRSRTKSHSSEIDGFVLKTVLTQSIFRRLFNVRYCESDR